MCVPAGDPDRDGILVADVLGEGLAAAAVEHDDAGHSAQAREQVVLPALVVMEPSDHALPREGDVRLPRGGRQQALTPQLHEPAALVLVPPKRNHLDALDHQPARPRMKSFTA